MKKNIKIIFEMGNNVHIIEMSVKEETSWIKLVEVLSKELKFQVERLTYTPK